MICLVLLVISVLATLFRSLESDAGISEEQLDRPRDIALRQIERCIRERKKETSERKRDHIDDELCRAIFSLLGSRSRSVSSSEDEAIMALDAVCLAFIAKLDSGDTVENPHHYLSRSLTNELHDARKKDSRDLRSYVLHTLKSPATSAHIRAWDQRLGDRSVKVVGLAADVQSKPKSTPSRLQVLVRPESFLYHEKGLAGEPIRARSAQPILDFLVKLLRYTGTSLPISEIVRVLEACVSFSEVIEEPIDEGQASGGVRREDARSHHFQSAILELARRPRAITLLDLDESGHSIVLARMGIDPFLDEGELLARTEEEDDGLFLEWWLEYQFFKKATLDLLQQEYGGRTRLDADAVAAYFGSSANTIRVTLSQAKTQIMENLARKAHEEEKFLASS